MWLMPSAGWIIIRSNKNVSRQQNGGGGGVCVCRSSSYQKEEGLYIFRSHLDCFVWNWMKDVCAGCVCRLCVCVYMFGLGVE